MMKIFKMTTNDWVIHDLQIRFQFRTLTCH